LQLFDRQAEMLFSRMSQSASAVASAFAHTLKGSARGIGAWKVAGAAEAVELAAAGGSACEVTVAVNRLGTAIDEAHIVITELLRAH
jgi:hypothetical protein